MHQKPTFLFIASLLFILVAQTAAIGSVRGRPGLRSDLMKGSVVVDIENVAAEINEIKETGDLEDLMNGNEVDFENIAEVVNDFRSGRARRLDNGEDEDDDHDLFLLGDDDEDVLFVLGDDDDDDDSGKKGDDGDDDDGDDDDGDDDDGDDDDGDDDDGDDDDDGGRRGDDEDNDDSNSGSAKNVGEAGIEEEEVCPQFEPINESFCSTEMECTYGVKPCCGSSLPAMICTCSPLGVFQCEMSVCDSDCLDVNVTMTVGNATMLNATYATISNTTMNATSFNATLFNTTAFNATAFNATSFNETSFNATSLNGTETSFYRKLAVALAPVIKTTTVHACPQEQPSVDLLPYCGEKPLSCFYGVENCCGHTVPQAICTCDAEKAFSCFNTHGCRNVDCGHLAAK